MKKPKTQKKDVWVKIAEGLYEKQTKIVKRRKKVYASQPLFKGLGNSGRSSGLRWKR